MKVTIENGKLFIDDQETKAEALSAQLLDNLLEEAISQKVIFNLNDKSHPLYGFFSNLQKDTIPGSDFIKEIERLKIEKREKISKLHEIEKSEEVQ